MTWIWSVFIDIFYDTNCIHVGFIIFYSIPLVFYSLFLLYASHSSFTSLRSCVLKLPTPVCSNTYKRHSSLWNLDLVRFLALYITLCQQSSAAKGQMFQFTREGKWFHFYIHSRNAFLSCLVEVPIKGKPQQRKCDTLITFAAPVGI